MAAVNLKVHSVTLNTALDNQFNGAGRTYTAYLLDDGATISGASATVDFNAATFDGTDSIVDLASPVYFTITSGTTVNGVSIVDDTSKVYTIESVTERIYTANGTYTLSDFIVKVGNN